MDAILGKAIGIIILHLVGLFIFMGLWILVLMPLFELPSLDVRTLVTIYLILDFMFFLLAKFDN